jgi:hypothetical protein
VAGGIGVVWAGLFAIGYSAAYFMGSVAGEEALANIVGNGFFAVYNALLVVAYRNVRKLGAFRSAVILAVVGLVPCLSPGFVLGIPFSLWLLIAVCQPQTGDAFERRA